MTRHPDVPPATGDARRRALDLTPGPASAPARRHVAAWALWDWGSAAFNAVITTFVFTRWLTSDAFADPGTVAAARAEGDAGGPATSALDAVLAQHSAWLGWGLTVAGLLIAITAPVIGARSDAGGRRRRWLAVHTAVTVVLCAAMFLVRPEPGSLTENLLLGIVLLATADVFFELAGVNYNAMLTQVSTPATRGRVSGIGWGAGYLGGIVLLVVLFVGFIDPEVGWFGVTGEDGLDVRVSVLLAAVWFAVFAVPVLLIVPEAAPDAPTARPGVAASYRRLVADIAGLWRDRRSTLTFLVASAVYRDGLAGVFTFGAVIASGTFGFSASEVVLFAIAANVVAGISTVVAGYLDDRVGPKAIIVTSLVGLLLAGTAVFLLHDGGATTFWVAGLLLCLFVGPAQSCSRSLLARTIPAGHESAVFGLYATTGRAASFLAPLAFSTFVTVSGSQHWGIVGLMLVVALGLALLLPIRVPADDAARPGTGTGEGSGPAASGTPAAGA